MHLDVHLGNLKSLYHILQGTFKGCQWGNYKHTYTNDEILESINSMSLDTPYLE